MICISHSEMFPRFCFVVKMSADNVIWQILDIFTNELSLFFNTIAFLVCLLRQKKSTELKKDSIQWWKCQKYAKSLGRPTFSQWQFFLFKSNSIDFFACFLSLKKSIGLKKDSFHWWKRQKFAKSRCRPTFSQRNKTSADNMIWQIFDIFTNKLSLFSTQSSF